MAMCILILQSIAPPKQKLLFGSHLAGCACLSGVHEKLHQDLQLTGAVRLTSPVRPQNAVYTK